MRETLHRAAVPILIMAIVYLSSVSIGMLMVHGGNSAALRHRDRIVARARTNDPSARAEARGSHAAAAAIDFSRNLFLAAVPDTIGGLTFILPIGFGAYRGWVGGLVSVDGRHQSRLRQLHSGVYYVVTMLLQLSGFILASGAGLHLGRAYFRGSGPFAGPRWLRIPRQAAIDVARLYLLIVPFFAAGSIFEYFAQ